MLTDNLFVLLGFFSRRNHLFIVLTCLNLSFWNLYVLFGRFLISVQRRTLCFSGAWTYVAKQLLIERVIDFHREF